MTHYDEEFVQAMSVDLGSTWWATGLVLQEGDTAWNPASTKGPLFGPSMVEYHMHVSGIDIREEDIGHACMGGERLDEWPFWRACREDPTPGSTRCQKHRFVNYAIAAE